MNSPEDLFQHLVTPLKVVYNVTHQLAQVMLDLPGQLNHSAAKAFVQPFIENDFEDAYTNLDNIQTCVDFLRFRIFSEELRQTLS